MTEAFVTGGTGFIGEKLVRLLVRKGVEVTCLSRSPDKAKHLEELGVEMVKGDITNRNSVKRAMDNQPLVFHLAAWYEIGVPSEKASLMRQINVEGTRNVLKIAWESGAEKIVYCSTVGALGSSGPADRIADENHTHDGRFQSIYVKTKREAHLIARDLIQRQAPIVTVLPGAVYGPGDTSFIAKQLSALQKENLSAIPDVPGILCYTHVEDVAKGMWLAAEKGKIGEEYILAGEPLTLEQFFITAASVMGVSIPRWRLPARLLRLLAWLCDHVPGGKLLTGGLPLSQEAVSMIADANWAFSSEKARQELGWRTRPLEKGLKDTKEWFKHVNF